MNNHVKLPYQMHFTEAQTKYNSKLKLYPDRRDNRVCWSASGWTPAGGGN